MSDSPRAAPPAAEEENEAAGSQRTPSGRAESVPADEKGGAAELERTLGLPAALSIGMGTMVGAGIFVFPGIAAGRAGPAATVSFALGAVLALLVAFPASELTTAMPRSGGGYHFVSRGLGTSFGSLVGIGQWFGLVFASAFYLVGFGYYLAEVARVLGLASSLPVPWIGFVTALVLTGVNLVGTEKAGALQNVIVVLLLTILGAFLLYWGAGRLGLVTLEGREAGAFAPYGLGPVVTTAATVFTSYLGFTQIAAVAGEIRRPGRNVPKAMIGSVVAVGLLYGATVFVAVTLLAPERLAEMGETAMVEVARSLAGRAGEVAFLGGGMLATLSSANASILSSSRSVFALSRDELVPSGASAVSERFRTPHVALLLAGAPIAGLTLLGRVEVLAEVASLLHLVMYGLICFAALALRRRSPPGYEPSFHAPGAPVLPVTAGLACFGLIGFMKPLSQAMGGGVVVLALLWYWFYAPSVELKEVDR